jgi:hypothetical protein
VPQPPQQPQMPPNQEVPQPPQQQPQNTIPKGMPA